MRPTLLIAAILLLWSADPAWAAASAAQDAAALGAKLVAQGNAEAAVAAYEKAAELDPKNSVIHHQLGEAYGLAAQQAGTFARIGWAKKTRLAYEKAVELDPKNLAARQSLMSFYQMAPGMMGGGMDKAHAQAAEIQGLDPARGRVATAILYIGEKKYDEARAEIDEVLRTEPENYAALFQTGRLAALTGEQLDRGEQALKKCLTLTSTPGAPGHDAAHWRLGNIHEKKGDKTAARTAYEASLKVNPKFQQAIDALAKLKN
ncbi:MAG: tetratricopeptide repeat protein [Candidatus Didemnitutus sp.]|nr:tetratricopeptide repeat protein [Candidatus Didemnitutus sp.]